MALLLHGHCCRAHRTGNSRIYFVNRAEANLKRFVNSLDCWGCILRKSWELLAHCMFFLETAPSRTQKMDFNLEKQGRKPLTELLKCLAADLDLFAPAYQSYIQEF